MIIPQAKAKELVEGFELNIVDSADTAKTLALYCVDEIISACEYNNVESYNTDWWNKVKDEINKIN